MPLRIIVVGAGLGGLGAAIALTRAGHDVQVCFLYGKYVPVEKSNFFSSR